MNTITIEKAATTIAATEKTFIFTKEQFLTFQENWKATKHHTATQHIAYNLIRGFAPDRGFTPIKSAHKIDSNSCDAWNGYNQALRPIIRCCGTRDSLALMDGRKATFKGIFGIDLTEDILKSLLTLEKR